MIVLILGCIDQAKAGAPLELARIGDFSIDLVDIKREKNTTTLHFAITKVGDTGSGHQSLQVSLIDDHGNEYSGDLNINLEGASDVVLNALPKGFTYVDMVGISMPKIALIETIKLGDIKEIAFNKVKFGRPQFMKNFGHLAITKGQSVAVGKWLSFTMEKILPALGHWELPITIENKEYNPLPAGVKVAAQYSDGTISWSQDRSTAVPALSKASVKVTLPIPSWVKGAPPQPKVLLNVYSDKSFDKGKMVLKIFPITPSGLPPLVGQGPKEIEDAFLNAYKRNGEQERMGNPLDLPHWFAGADEPKDEKDVLVQEFPAVSEFGKSAIVWDKQAGAIEVFVLHGAIWETYLSVGGPYHVLEGKGRYLGKPISPQYKNPITRQSHVDFTHGYITADASGKNYRIFPYEDGKLLTTKGSIITMIDLPTSSEHRIHVPNIATRGLHGASWSPDGKKIAISARADPNRGRDILIFDLQTQQLDNITQRAGVKWWQAGFVTPVWSLDGSKIAFWAAWEITRSDSVRYIDLRTLTVRLVGGSEGIGASAIHPTISPDGNKIAFLGRYEPYGIYIVNLDTNQQTYLVSGLYPAWSPGGSKIAFVSGEERRLSATLERTLNVIDVKNRTVRQIINFKPPATGPYDTPPRPISWSPDGSKLAFINVTKEGKEILIVDLEMRIGRRISVGDYYTIDWWAPREGMSRPPAEARKAKREINLTYTVDQFTPESATGTAFSLPVRKEGYEAYFPWVASHINTAWSIILPITFQVTDSSGNPISDAQIFMGQQKLGLTDNSGKFTYKYVVRIPKRENKIIKLPFSAKKNGASTSINIPFSWSLLGTTSIHITTKKDLDRYKKILYQYNFFESKLPLPKELTFITPFLPLLKTVYDLQKGPRIGDQIAILLIEHRIAGKEPVVWAYWEQIKRGEKILYFATGWILSPEDKQRILNTYFLIKKA